MKFYRSNWTTNVTNLNTETSSFFITGKLLTEFKLSNETHLKSQAMYSSAESSLIQPNLWKQVWIERKPSSPEFQTKLRLSRSVISKSVDARGQFDDSFDHVHL